MITQFFGNYLLNEHLVTPNQLIEALQEKNNTRLKLGVLAINAGYMTASEVEKVHMEQTKRDKRFGDLAVELGFVTEAQIDELLGAQKVGYLLLGQALVDKGYMDNATFESAINAYKEKYSLSDDDMLEGDNFKVDTLTESLIDIDSKDKDLYRDFLSLLFNNLVRFIGDDFTPLAAVTSIPDADKLYQTTQGITGEFAANTSIIADEKTSIAFASRYASEDLTEFDEYVTASACDFINLHNGLFTVNVSNEKGVELRLTPPLTEEGVKDDSRMIILPVCYPFGTVYFTITV